MRSGDSTELPEGGRRPKTASQPIVALESRARIILMDKADGPFHLQTHECSGSTAINGAGKVVDSAGSCTAVDKDGDAWWLSYYNGPQEIPGRSSAARASTRT